jgi:hypothetical protein
LDYERHAGKKSHALKVLLRRRMQKTVVAHGMHFWRQNMAEIALNKLDSFEVHNFLTSSIVSIFPPESDVSVIDFDYSGISYRCSGNVSAEVFDGACAVAAGLDVYTPVFSPDSRVHLPLALLKFVIEGLFKGGLQHGKMDKKVGVFDAAYLSLAVFGGFSWFS